MGLQWHEVLCAQGLVAVKTKPRHSARCLTIHSWLFKTTDKYPPFVFGNKCKIGL